MAGRPVCDGRWMVETTEALTGLYTAREPLRTRRPMGLTLGGQEPGAIPAGSTSGGRGRRRHRHHRHHRRSRAPAEGGPH